MELLLIVVLMAVLYLVPELLRQRKGPAKYKYPSIPDAPPTVEVHNKEPLGEKVHVRSAIHQQEALPTVMDTQISPNQTMAVQNIKTSFSEPLSWQKILDRDAVINGLIFSEILQPPRAYCQAKKSRYKNRGK